MQMGAWTESNEVDFRQAVASAFLHGVGAMLTVADLVIKFSEVGLDAMITRDAEAFIAQEDELEACSGDLDGDVEPYSRGSLAAWYVDAFSDLELEYEPYGLDGEEALDRISEEVNCTMAARKVAG